MNPDPHDVDAEKEGENDGIRLNVICGDNCEAKDRNEYLAL